MFATACGTYGEVMFWGKLVERTPVRERARRRRASTVLSSRVGMRRVVDLPTSVGSRREVSVRMDCGEGRRGCGAGAGVARACDVRRQRKADKVVGRCIVFGGSDKW